MHCARLHWSVLIVAAALWTACGGSPTQPTPPGSTGTIPPIGSTAPTPPGRPLTKTSFVAFGDSITAGVIVPSGFNGLLKMVIAPASYPYKLQAILAGEHSNQRIQVYNEGVAGECAGSTGLACDGGTGLPRFPGVLSADSPQVLLLLEGVNDLYAGTDIGTIVGYLRTMTEEAQGAGATVLIGTLLPQVRGELRARSVDEIAPFNAQLRAMASGLGVTVVDFYTPFSQDLSLIGPDGLHPTDAGYTKMAQIWASAIDNAFSIPLPQLTGSGSRKPNQP